MPELPDFQEEAPDAPLHFWEVPPLLIRRFPRFLIELQSLYAVNGAIGRTGPTLLFFGPTKIRNMFHVFASVCNFASRRESDV
ncbi:MAG: hypothetical protein IPK83_18020 [Planctomycetes bacterium]|nr:hypothetical protein [Planctomycetota bacterium]